MRRSTRLTHVLLKVSGLNISEGRIGTKRWIFCAAMISRRVEGATDWTGEPTGLNLIKQLDTVCNHDFLQCFCVLSGIEYYIELA
jgi:hypothetical protein